MTSAWGKFSDLKEVEKAKRHALTPKGFREYPDGFNAIEYEINQPEWLEGFGD